MSSWAANVVLIGPMGCGKTTVGALLAARLGRPFVDLDREVERSAGRSVAQLFAEQGEPAFRALEAAVCLRYSAAQGAVIATGGGTLLDPRNAAALARGGRLVRLCARPEVLWPRVAAARPRPLLERLPRAARPERLAALCRARDPLYDVGCEVDAEREASEVANELARWVRSPLCGSTRLVQRIAGSHSAVYLRAGLRRHLGAALAVHGVEPGPVIVVTDPHVGELHGAAALTGLEEAGFAPRVVQVPRGEAAKSVVSLELLWEALLEHGVQRTTPVVALGGGAVTDVVGLAAGTILRGVPWVAVPTTLLGMVDASLGGKTAINLSRGKNLAGAFVPPLAVVIDPECLRTLPAGTPPGMAEVLKAALIGDRALWSELEQPTHCDPRLAVSTDSLARAVRVKLERVAADPLDHGVRRTLNLGHTFAHGFERAADFALSHGHAVSVGLAAAAAVSEREGYAEPGLCARVEGVLEAWGLPTRLPARLRGPASEAMRHDKKARGVRVEAILLCDLGCVERVWLPFSALEVGLDRVLRDHSGNSMSSTEATPVAAASPQF